MRILFKERIVTIALLLILSVGAGLVGVAQEPPTVITPGETTSGVLSTDDFSDLYLFIGTSGQVVDITATSSALPLSLLLTDGQGTTIAQALPTGGTTTSLLRIALPQTGSYLITVFGNVTNTPQGAYEISLVAAGTGGAEPAPTTVETDSAAAPVDPAAPTQDQAPVVEQSPAAAPTQSTVIAPDTAGGQSPESPQLSGGQPITTLESVGDVSIQNGMEVRLQWSAAADLNLNVRDPQGNQLFFDNRSTPIGGSFGFDANGLCDIISEAPVEQATWSPGFLPAGSYEILVFYRQDCEGVGPANFNVSVNVNGVSLPAIDATLSPPVGSGDSVYVANFVIAEDGSATINPGGLYPDSAIRQLTVPAAQLRDNAIPLQIDVPVRGAIFEQQDLISYSFEGQPDDIVTITMTAQTGSLDTLLQLIDPAGNIIEVNDDGGEGTNSVISNLRLLTAGTYTVVATRYGKDLGGTEGEFELLLTGASEALPEEIANLDLPEGAIEVVLTWNTNADLQLLVRDPVGAAVFDDVPLVNSGGVLELAGNVGCIEDGQPLSYIRWPLGLLRPGIYEAEVQFQNTCDDPTPVSFTLTTIVNEELAFVERQNPTIGDRFVITFEIAQDGEVNVGPGGFIDLQTELQTLDLTDEPLIPITSGQTVNGSITLENVFDVYTFQGTAGQVVSVDMTATSGTLDTKLFLVDANGIQVAANDDRADEFVLNDADRTNALINAFLLPADGEYRIVATRFATIYGGTVGAYTLNLQIVQ